MSSVTGLWEAIFKGIYFLYSGVNGIAPFGNN
jgi:hypothetical protein